MKEFHKGRKGALLVGELLQHSLKVALKGTFFEDSVSISDRFRYLFLLAEPSQVIKPAPPSLIT